MTNPASNDPVEGLGLNGTPVDAEYFIQRHKHKGRSHLDFRVGNKNQGLYSWAVLNDQIPDAGAKPTLAPQTPIHNYGYGFVNNGKNVELLDRGLAKVTRREGANDIIEMQTQSLSGMSPGLRRRLLMIRTAKANGMGPQDYWLFKNAALEQEKVAAAKRAKVTVRIRDGYGKFKGICFPSTAETDEEKKKGLMFRKKLASLDGMIFKGCHSFWMKNVNFPLELVCLDDRNTVIDVIHMAQDNGAKSHKTPIGTEKCVELSPTLVKRTGIRAGYKFEFA